MTKLSQLHKEWETSRQGLKQCEAVEAGALAAQILSKARAAEIFLKKFYKNFSKFRPVPSSKIFVPRRMRGTLSAAAAAPLQALAPLLGYRAIASA